MTLKISENRRARKWTRKELAGRLLWEAASPLFAWSPRPFWGWRSFLLRCFGARIEPGVHLHPSARIAIPWNLTIGSNSAVGDRAILYCLGPLTIGRDVTISQGAHLCGGSHDYANAAMPLLKEPIVIESSAWICADAFIGPGVRIGEGAVVGARAVAMSDIGAWDVAVGNPARPVKKRTLKP